MAGDGYGKTRLRLVPAGSRPIYGVAQTQSSAPEACQGGMPRLACVPAT
jgi:hypothetical protein